MKRTKIVATLGPATMSRGRLTALIRAGADVIRVNSAHTPDARLPVIVALVRACARRAGRIVGILQDLPGPKIRLGKLREGGIELRRGEAVTLFPGASGGSATSLPVAYPYLARDLKAGHAVYIADGLVRLTVDRVARTTVACHVDNGGHVTSGKGVNLPDTSLTLKAFTAADRRHMLAGMRAGVDFVGISFVGNRDDMIRVKRAARGHGRPPFIIAKIERREALKNLPGILAETDGIMVARGDLGVEISFADIPGVQRHIVHEARQAGRPVIVATQVLESMLEHPRPTRAEATDVAHAVAEGVDAIMLSGETSIGKFPVEAVRVLHKVIHAAQPAFSRAHEKERIRITGVSDRVIRDVCDMAEDTNARAIVVPSRSGRTVLRTSRIRPSVPVLALVRDPRLLNVFSLCWGVDALCPARHISPHDMVGRVRALVLACRHAKRGERVIVVSGGPGVPAGETGMVQIVQI